MRVTRVLPAAFVFLAACSLFVDTSGLDDGSGATTDGGRDAPSEATSDATPGSDSGRGGDDAPSEGASDAGADARTPCPDGGFCDDFDNGPLGARWSNENQDRGTISLVADAVTPPSSFRTDITVANFAGSTSLVKTISPGPRKVRCELDVKLLSGAPSAGEVDLIDFIMRTAGNHHVYFAAFDGTFAVAEFAPGQDGGADLDRVSNVPPLPTGKWVHVVFETDGQSASVSYDGAVKGTLGSLSTPNASGRDLAFGVTFASAAVNTALSVQMDDVACSFPP
jgi:hypothetical protein